MHEPLTKEQSEALSGRRYVSARIRSWAGDQDTTPKHGHAAFSRLPIVAPQNCEHTFSVCMTRKCIESWSCDWNLYLKRTGGGREVIAKLELSDNEVARLCDDENRSIAELSIAVFDV